MNAAFRRFAPMVVSYAASTGSLVDANVAQLLAFAVLARTFGPAEFGLYVSFTAVTSIAVHLCGLGAAECLVRRIPQQPADYPALLGHNLVLIAITGAVLVAAGMTILPFVIVLSPDPGIDASVTFLLLVTNIVLVRVAMLAEGVYLGHSRFGAANRSVVAFAFVRTGTAALACLVFGVSTIAQWAIWQFVCHILFILAYAIPVLRLGRPRLAILREEIRLGILFATPFVFRAVRQNADLMVLGLVSTPEIIASYAIARRITDASYMAIDALNRIVYPGLAAASVNGIHHAMKRTRHIFVVALAIGCLAGATIFLAAPFLPLLFGTQYTSLVSFCRIMGWCILFPAVWSVAIDTLGAAGRHGVRALVLNTGNGLGALLIALATFIAPPTGTFIVNYLIEIGIMIAAWAVLLQLVARDAAKEQAGMAWSGYP